MLSSAVAPLLYLWILIETQGISSTDLTSNNNMSAHWAATLIVLPFAVFLKILIKNVWIKSVHW